MRIILSVFTFLTVFKKKGGGVILYVRSPITLSFYPVIAFFLNVANINNPDCNEELS